MAVPQCKVLVPGLPADVVDWYLSGECLELASAVVSVLRKRWGINADIYGITEHHRSRAVSRPKLTEPFHYVVRYGDYYLDVMGLWTADDLLDYWFTENFALSSLNGDYVYRLERQSARVSSFTDFGADTWSLAAKMVSAAQLYSQ